MLSFFQAPYKTPLYKFCDDFVKAHMRSDMPNSKDIFRIQSFLISISFMSALGAYRTDCKVKKDNKMPQPKNYDVALVENILAYTSFNIQYLLTNYQNYFSKEDTFLIKDLVVGVLNKQIFLANIEEIAKLRLQTVVIGNEKQASIYEAFAEIISGAYESQALKPSYPIPLSISGFFEKTSLAAGIPTMAEGMFQATDGLINLVFGVQKVRA